MSCLINLTSKDTNMVFSVIQYKVSTKCNMLNNGINCQECCDKRFMEEWINKL